MASIDQELYERGGNVLETAYVVKNDVEYYVEIKNFKEPFIVADRKKEAIITYLNNETGVVVKSELYDNALSPSSAKVAIDKIKATPSNYF